MKVKEIGPSCNIIGLIDELAKRKQRLCSGSPAPMGCNRPAEALFTRQVLRFSLVFSEHKQTI
jgi:hypothetical protein